MADTSESLPSVPDKGHSAVGIPSDVDGIEDRLQEEILSCEAIDKKVAITIIQLVHRMKSLLTADCAEKHHKILQLESAMQKTYVDPLLPSTQSRSGTRRHL